MYSSERLHQVSQLIVLGRGKAGEYKLSTASYDRALAASTFCDINDSVETVIFSGGFSAHTDLDTRYEEFGEAALMADLADLPPSVEVILEEKSANTMENILFSAEFIEPDRPVGILAHNAQLRRGLHIAKRVLPGETIIGVQAEEFGARSEGLFTAVAEAVQLLWTEYLMLGVKPGDILELYKRNEHDQRIKQIAGSGLRKLCKATRIPVPQQYR
jgi:hypothetical protein